MVGGVFKVTREYQMVDISISFNLGQVSTQWTQYEVSVSVFLMEMHTYYPTLHAYFECPDAVIH